MSQELHPDPQDLLMLVAGALTTAKTIAEMAR